MVGQGGMAVIFHLLHLLGLLGWLNEACTCHANFYSWALLAMLTTLSTSQGSWLSQPSMSPIHVTPQLVVLEGVLLPLSSLLIQ